MTSPDEAGFKQVVLFEYPRKGTWTLAFLAGDVPFEDDRPSSHSVFVPTAPNPTTGFMLIVPREDIRATALTVEEAFQMIVSAGVAVPQSLRLPASLGQPTELIDVNVMANPSGENDIDRSGGAAADSRPASAAGGDGG